MKHNIITTMHFIFSPAEKQSPSPGQISITWDKPTASNGIVFPLHIVAMHIYCDVFTVIEHRLLRHRTIETNTTRERYILCTYVWSLAAALFTGTVRVVSSVERDWQSLRKIFINSATKIMRESWHAHNLPYVLTFMNIILSLHTQQI